MNPEIVTLSRIDEERFGIRTAWARALEESSLSYAMEFCRKESVRLLIARCSTCNLSLVHKLEQNGFLLMDALVHYRRNLVNIPVSADPDGMVVRPVRPGEEPALHALAGLSFQNYIGHYHSDPRLDPALCDEAYKSWAVRSCTSREVADEVLVAASAQGLLGLLTLRLDTPEQGVGPLFCIAPGSQRKGLSRLLMIQGLEWCRARGAQCMVMSTQLTNLAVQKAWMRLGFELSDSQYTFHKWFD